jgi:zinc D-Ala-D-Ala carboxypeptidase
LIGLQRTGAGARLVLFVACVLGFTAIASAGAQPPALPVAALRSAVADLPQDIREGILARPREFLDLSAELLKEPAELFVLVDKHHPLAADHAPTDLVDLRDYPKLSIVPGVQLRRIAMPDLLEMSAAAGREGVTLTLSSTYRSYARQKEVYAGVVAEDGQAAADRVSAQPGRSQHQLGTAVDFGSITDAFASTAAGKWLARRAWEFGFSMSYPDGYEDLTGYRYECWHFRYITKAGTRMQREFFRDVQQELLVFLNDHRAELEKIVARR